MNREMIYLPEVLDDFRALDESQRILVKQAVAWVKKNPLSDTEEAMVNGWAAKAAVSRLDFLKVKLCDARLRIVYQLILEKDRMALIVIVTHEDDEV